MGVTEFTGLDRHQDDHRGERLAVIAAVTLPITATSSIVGMNVIVNDETHWVWLMILLAFMATTFVRLQGAGQAAGWW